jgi:dTDP-4-amino-4,6-dideoxygalactose transaminase
MMRIPLLDLKAQYAEIRTEIREAIDRVCDSQEFILGTEVAMLERDIAAMCGVQHGIGVSSGTDALLAALMVIGVGPGTEVVTTAYSFFATAGVVARLGARPVFVDIDPVTVNLNTEQVETAVTPRTRAVMPVHLFGRCADLDAVRRATGLREDVAIVEDAAQALGAVDDKGRPAGSVGAVGCFSFFPSKNLGGFGDGGMIVAQDEALAARLRALRVHGSEVRYHHRVVGGNFRLDALQAAVLRVKLQRLAAWTAARRLRAARYRELIGAARLADLVQTPPDHPGHVYNQFVVRCPRRAEVRQFLTQAGVGTQVYYPVPLHLQECFRELGYRPGDLPESERASAESLALPMYPELTEDQQEYVVAQLKAFFEGR